MGGNFIHFQTAQKICKIENANLRSLRQPIVVKGFNGVEAPSITHKLSLELHVERHSQSKCDFLVTNLGSNEMILGNKWMKEHGAIPVPATGELWFIGGHCRHPGAAPVIPLSEHRLPDTDPRSVVSSHSAPDTNSESSDDSLERRSKKKRIRAHRKKVTPNQRSRIREIDRIQNATTPQQRSIRCTLPPAPEAKEARIALIGAHALMKLARKKDSYIMAISMRDIMEQHEKDEVEEQDCREKLPKELQDLADVFSGKAANTLPPHREGVDHHIVLEEGKRPDWVPRFYRSTRAEMEEIRRWVTENLSRGFIEASMSPWASPIMFVKKPGGGIRLCVDYRKLNAITKKDRYPIPLIEETMANISGCAIMTKLDIRKAFNRIRIATPEDEELLTFCTPIGNFKPKVLGFGPTNGPASFQRFINNTLFEYLNVFCSAYMDDILIYSKDAKDHMRHVRLVLLKLREAGLQVDINKSEFGVTKTKYLGLVVSTEGIEMDPEKTQVIRDWEIPRSVTETQSFVGFCNFYRRFIKNFSRILRPVIELTKVENKKNFKWNDRAQAAFQEIKDRILESPVLIHFDHSKTAYVEADSSDYVHGGCLSQMKDGVLHPVAFFSQKLSPAECNYEIYDKELLAIVNSLEQWRPELEGIEFPIQVLTDHKALEYFMTSKKLSRRQARWALTLSKYNFQITYRPGKENGKADALTRKPGDRPDGDDDERQKHQFQTVITPQRMHPDLTAKLLRIAQNEIDFEFAGPLTVAPVEAEENEETESESEDSLPEPIENRVRMAQLTDETCLRVIRKLDSNEQKDHEVTLAHATAVEGAMYIDDRLWVPESIRTEVIDTVHITPETAHPGLAKTLFHLKKSYYWPNMHKTVAQYLRNCHPCRRAKPSRDQYHGLLNPLQIANRPFKHISMDFVTKLPPTRSGNNTIAVLVCRLTKRRILEPLIGNDDGTSAKATAKLVYLTMRRLGVGLIETFVSDRGSQWDCEFWAHLCRLWKIKRLMSTAFHPQTDGQTEIVNQETERIIRTYTSFQQDDWDEWLPEAEAAMNANPSATTGISPFFATNGYEPNMTFDLQISTPLPPPNAREATERRRAENMAKLIAERSQFLQEQISLAQSQMEANSNTHRQPSPNYQAGDKVWLSMKNIKTQRPSKKFDDKNIHCEIIRRIGRDSYELHLPDGMSRIHPVFHTSLLRPDPDDPLPRQRQPNAEPVLIDGDDEDVHEEWEIEAIVDSRYRYGFLEYKVKWVGHPMEERKWYRDNLFENSKLLVAKFHSDYPDKPAPRPDGIRVTAREAASRREAKEKAVDTAMQNRRSARLNAQRNQVDLNV
jgi:hypothetical protein